VHKTVEVDLALITYDDARRKDLALYLVKTANQPDAHPLYRLPTVPGIGKVLSLVLLYEIHRLERFPRVQACASYAPLITCSTQSGGNRWGTAGQNIGNAHLQWAFSAAATLFLRHNPAGQRLLARLERTHDNGTALSILAPQLARAVYDLLKRTTAFAMDLFLRASRSRAGAPAV
jgi:transposase